MRVVPVLASKKRGKPVVERLKLKIRLPLLYLSHQMAKRTRLVRNLAAWAPPNQEQA
jgi:ABC-type molybdate transport system ATPase subunit